MTDIVVLNDRMIEVFTDMIKFATQLMMKQLSIESCQNNFDDTEIPLEYIDDQFIEELKRSFSLTKELEQPYMISKDPMEEIDRQILFLKTTRKSRKLCDIEKWAVDTILSVDVAKIWPHQLEY